MLKKVIELEKNIAKLEREHRKKISPLEKELKTIRKSCQHKEMPDTDGPDICPRCGLTSNIAFLI